MGKRLLSILACLMLTASMAFAQRTVTGSVIDKSTGEPVIGASVLVEGTNIGVATDVKGRFTLNNVPATAKTLKISYVGMEDVEILVSNNVKVKMVPVSVQTDDVVVVAYGTRKKDSVTGSIAQIGSEQIEDRITTSVTGALEGAAPGVQVNNTYGEPGSSPSIVIRGIGTITGTTAPLYIVDGVEFHGSIAEINSADVENYFLLLDKRHIQ